MSLSERVYRLLLRAYPRRYRQEFAEPMIQLFRDRLRAARTFSARMGFWIRILADWAVTVPAQHFERRPHHPRLASLDPARRCLFFARSEASSFSSSEIRLEHLLLGILRQDPTLVPDREAVVSAIEIHEGVERRTPPMEDLRLSHQTIRVWVAAKAIAAKAGRKDAAPRDLLAGILREKDSFATELLREQGGENR